jgi:rhamnogalacturonyl hydrolase YesR
MRIPLVAAIAVLAAASVRAADSAQPAVPEPKDVLAVMERVADWQLANPRKPIGTDSDTPPRAAEYSPRGWVMGAAYTGIMALGEISESPRFLDAMRRMGETNQWKPGPRPYHADDHCVIQTYAELFLRDRRPEMIKPSTERFEMILAHPAPGGLEFVGDNRETQWSWCDALFMAPPAWIRMWKATGKQAYLDFAVTNWWKTSDYLYDKDEHLFFRDSTYFAKREANGKKIFWSRGNGWVFAGLARVLSYLPADHPSRPKFERQFREMAAKLITIQQPNGYWTSSLLDPEEYPAEEESGTAFYTFGLVWGINHGLLDRGTFLAPALKGWAALTRCVLDNGRLIHVQPIGADPKKFDPNSTEPFGVGGFLLSGSQIYRLGKK